MKPEACSTLPSCVRCAMRVWGVWDSWRVRIWAGRVWCLAAATAASPPPLRVKRSPRLAMTAQTFNGHVQSTRRVGTCLASTWMLHLEGLRAQLSKAQLKAADALSCAFRLSLLMLGYRAACHRAIAPPFPTQPKLSPGAPSPPAKRWAYLCVCCVGFARRPSVAQRSNCAQQIGHRS